LTLQKAFRYVILTAADTESPPTGKVPSITPANPLISLYFRIRIVAAPTIKSPHKPLFSGSLEILNSVEPSKILLVTSTEPSPAEVNPGEIPRLIAKPVTRPCRWSTCAPNGQTR